MGIGGDVGLVSAFVTLTLAVKSSETWAAYRTGHKSSVINGYRRAARSASELGLGWLNALDRALPETRSELALTGSTAAPKPAKPKTSGSIAQSVELRTFNP